MFKLANDYSYYWFKFYLFIMKWTPCFLRNIFSKFLNIFKKTYYPIVFGFDCGDGWKPMICDLIVKIGKLDKDKQIRIIQIKEKFGGLRFYVEGANDEIYDLIQKYEEMSYHVCEVCGEYGNLRKDLDWIRTLCVKHYNEEKYIKEKNDYEIEKFQ